MVEQNTVLNKPPAGTDSQQPKNQSRGYLKYVAIGCAVVILLIAVGGFFVYKGIKSFLSGVSEKYTSDQPMVLPTVDASEDEALAIMDRVEVFTDALNRNASPSPLILNSRDINVLVNNHPKWVKLAGKAYMTIDGERIKGQISIPLDEVGNLFEGRYLNGSAVFRFGMSSGRLLAFIDSIEVGGKPIPEEFMGTIRAQNFAEKANEDPDVIAVLEKLESITIRDGSLVVTPIPRQEK